MQFMIINIFYFVYSVIHSAYDAVYVLVFVTSPSIPMQNWHSKFISLHSFHSPQAEITFSFSVSWNHVFKFILLSAVHHTSAVWSWKKKNLPVARSLTLVVKLCEPLPPPQHKTSTSSIAYDSHLLHQSRQPQLPPHKTPTRSTARKSPPSPSHITVTSST